MLKKRNPISGANRHIDVSSRAREEKEGYTSEKTSIPDRRYSVAALVLFGCFILANSSPTYQTC